MSENFEQGGRGVAMLPEMGPEAEPEAPIMAGNRLFSKSGTIREVEDVVMHPYDDDKGYFAVVRVGTDGSRQQEKLLFGTLRQQEQNFAFVDHSRLPANFAMENFSQTENSQLQQIDKQLVDIATGKENSRFTNDRLKSLLDHRKNIIRKMTMRLSRAKK